MKKFTVNTWLKKGLDRVDFAPGDEVPKWAEELVGDHVWTDGKDEAAASEAPEAETDEDPAEDATEPETAKDAPEGADFTRPATRRTTGTRKK